MGLAINDVPYVFKNLNLTDDEHLVKKWFYIPAMLFLTLTLISGVWLRLQWSWPQFFLFRADYLIHGHSHAALLGWIFLGFAGLVLETGTIRRTLPVRLLKFLGGTIVFITMALFVIFIRDGYNPLSIILSTLHMLLGYIIAWLFFRHARQDSHVAGQLFLEGAVFWMIIATAGTWLLALGKELPTIWIDIAVQFYLHVLFKGWFVFALSGLAFRFMIDTNRKKTIWPFWLMMAGLIPSLFPQLELESHLFTIIGLVGTILYGVGGLAIVWFVVRSNMIYRRRWFCIELMWTGIAGSVLVFCLPVAVALPAVRHIWLNSDLLVIGYIHLLLLVTVSSLLLFAIIQRIASVRILIAMVSGRVEYYNVRFASIGLPTVRPVFGILLRTGSWLFIAGSISMVTALFVTGVFQISGNIPPFQVQKLLFFTGLTALTGVLIMLTAVRR